MDTWLAVASWAVLAWAGSGALGWVVAVSRKRNDDWAENFCMIPVCLLFGPVTFALMKWGR